MGVTINKKSTKTEPQPKPPEGLNSFYWYQIFALDSAVVEVQEIYKPTILSLFANMIVWSCIQLCLNKYSICFVNIIKHFMLKSGSL